MRPAGRPGGLFAAFSEITVRAFRNDRLLSCPVLSKAPNYGRVLERYLGGHAPEPRGTLPFLRAAARYAAANVGHLLFLAASAACIRLCGWKRPKVLESGESLIVIDSFALLPAIAAEENYTERYLPGLYEAARERGHGVVRLHRLYGGRSPGMLRRACAVLAGQGDGLLEAHLFTPGDWLRLLRHILVYPFALRGLVRSLRDTPAASPEAAIREALIACAGQCVLVGEARRIAGYRLGRLLAARPGRVHICSWHENQTVNKALQRGLAQAEAETGVHIRVIGAQLFLWPPELLNNHPDEGEATLGIEPDKVLVNGPYFLPEPVDPRYAIGPSLRYAHLFRGRVRFAEAAGENFVEANGIQMCAPSAPARTLPAPDPALEGLGRLNADGNENCRMDASKVAAPESRLSSLPEAESIAPVVSCRESTGPVETRASLPLLVLLSYHPEETRRVLELVRPLATARNGRGAVYRFHPATRPRDYASLLPENPVLAGGPFMEALDGAGAVIGSGSGALAEAAALGVPVLAVGDEGEGAVLNYLPAYGRGVLWEAVARPDEVEPALASLERRAEQRGEQARRLRDMLFTEPTRECIDGAFEL